MSIFSSSYGANKINKDDLNRSLRKSYIDISKVEKDSVPVINKATGEVKNVTCHPKRTADILKIAVDSILASKASFLDAYLEKPIILSYDHNTMWTDGNRIFANPLFTEQLLKAGNRNANKWDELPDTMKLQQKNDAEYTEKRLHIQLRCVKFVIIHECYHMLYNHIYRMYTLIGKGADTGEWNRSNIATDLEINRDIESIFSEYEGCTKEIEGIWFKNEKYKLKNGKYMVKNTCEEVYEYLKENNIGGEDNGPEITADLPTIQEEVDVEDIFEAGWNYAYNGVDGKKITYDDIAKLF